VDKEKMLQEIIGSYLDERNMSLATMESLTGGLIASALTDVHNSSAHFIGGIVSYSTMLKERMGVPHDLMKRYGVISEETAVAMAQAVRRFLDADIGLGITGVAGPDEQEGKPVGTVYIAIDGPYGLMTGVGSEECAGSNREDNKQAATISALNLLRTYLEYKDYIAKGPARA
jgi:nicotinamide-nucleotide amidase